MLPDLRVLILATVTTFLATTGAGLLASVRLMPEPLATMQAERDTPVIRVALSWQDLNQTMKSEPIPAAIRNATELASPDRPANAAMPAPETPVSAESPSASPADSIAAKPDSTEPTSAPVTTGAIPQAPPAAAPSSAPSEQPKFAARPDPAEAANHLPPPPEQAAAPVRAEPKKAKPAPQLRRHRVVRRPDPTQAVPVPATENGANFFTEFGSRMNR